MNCFNHQTTEVVASCKKCGHHLCSDCIDIAHKVCYECNQLDYNLSKGILFKRIIPWFVGALLVFFFLVFANTNETAIPIGFIVLISYIVFCLPWILFSTKDARMRGKILGATNAMKSGLDLNNAAQAGNTLWILIKSLFIGIFLVPYNVIKNLIVFFRTKSILKKR